MASTPSIDTNKSRWSSQTFPCQCYRIMLQRTSNHPRWRWAKITARPRVISLNTIIVAASKRKLETSRKHRVPWCLITLRMVGIWAKMEVVLSAKWWPASKHTILRNRLPQWQEIPTLLWSKSVIATRSKDGDRVGLSPMVIKERLKTVWLPNLCQLRCIFPNN